MMSLKDAVNEIVMEIEIERCDLLKEIDSLGGLSPDRRNALREDLSEIVSSALLDATVTLELDEQNLYFLKPLTVALITFGSVFGEIGKVKSTSKLMSDDLPLIFRLPTGEFHATCFS